MGTRVNLKLGRRVKLEGMAEKKTTVFDKGGENSLLGIFRLTKQ